jgi:hypothetical protein
MATVTRYSVAKTQDSCSSPSTTCGSKVYSETADLRDAYYYGTSVGGDVSDAPAPDYARLAPKTGDCA